MTDRSFTIRWSYQATKMVKAISDKRIRQKIYERVAELAHEPEKQGKPLTGDLIGYRSLRVAGQRYRVIYQVERETVKIYVVAVGIRKEGGKTDIYSLARKLIRLRLLDPPSE